MNLDEEIIGDLKHFCFICKKPLMLACGTPYVGIGGCCVGAYINKTRWLTSLRAHYHCFSELNARPKMILSYDQVKKLLIPYYQKRMVSEDFLLKKEPCCKGDWRKEVIAEKRKYEKMIKRLRS